MDLLFQSINSVKTKKNEQKENESLPWTEKYRPNTINDIVSHKTNIEILNNYLKIGNYPHLLFYGPAGTGKTSTILAFAREFYQEYFHSMVLEINASEERGIDMVRDKIKNYVSKTTLFGSEKSFKLIILDEADAMTAEAQAKLRRVMEDYSNSARFCLICNYHNKITEAIQSRCTQLKFPTLGLSEIKKKIICVANENNIIIDNRGIEILVKLYKGDMRKILNNFYSMSIVHKELDEHKILEFEGYPSNDIVSYIIDLARFEIFEKAYKKIKKIMHFDNYSLSDILTEITEILLNNAINKNTCVKKTIYLFENLKNIDINLTNLYSLDIQISALIAVFKLSEEIIP